MRSGHSTLPHRRKEARRWSPARVLAGVLLLGMAACGALPSELGPGEPKPQQPIELPSIPLWEFPDASNPGVGESSLETGDALEALLGKESFSHEHEGTMGPDGPMTGGSGAAPRPDGLSPSRSFPWPPSAPSAYMSLTEELPFQPDGQLTLGDVGKRLHRALKATQYTEVAWFSTPGEDGFILLTRIEQIHPDGTSFEGRDRFAGEVTRQPRSLSERLQDLFLAPPGHFRIIALVVKTGEIPFSDKPPTHSELTQLIQKGPRQLDSEVARIPFTSHHQVYALIYEFTKRRSEPEPKFVQVSALPAEQHLRAAGLLLALSKAGS